MRFDVVRRHRNRRPLCGVPSILSGARIWAIPSFSLSFGRGGDRSLEQGGDDRLVRVTNLAWSALAPHELDGGKISIDEIVVAAGGYCIDVDHRPLARLGAREQFGWPHAVYLGEAGEALHRDSAFPALIGTYHRRLEFAVAEGFPLAQ